MNTTITVERQGRRSYIRGNTYPHRDAIRAAGAHWDAAEKAWWIGSDEKAREVAATLSAATETPVHDSRETLAHDAREIIGRGAYKGRTYYVIGRVVSRGRTRFDRDEIAPVKNRDGSRIKLASTDGSMVFWASVDEVSVEKRYQRLASIKSLREYAEKARESVGYVPRYGVDYCGGICPVGGHRCTADHPCHDCE